MSTTSEYNSDYKKHKVTDQDLSMISKIIALYDRTQIDGPNSRVFGETESMSDAAKKEIANATRDFLKACRDIAIQERISYRDEGKWIDRVPGKIEQAEGDDEKARLTEERDAEFVAARKSNNTYAYEQAFIKYNGVPGYYESKNVKVDKTADLNILSTKALEDYATAIKESGAFKAMVIGVEGVERSSTGALSDQWAEENQMPKDEAMKHVYSGMGMLFGQDGLPGESHRKGSPYPAYDMVIGITKAFSEQNMHALKQKIDSMDERPRAVQMLFEREASSSFKDSAWELKRIAKGQSENAQPDQVDAGPSF